MVATWLPLGSYRHIQLELLTEFPPRRIEDNLPIINLYDPRVHSIPRRYVVLALIMRRMKGNITRVCVIMVLQHVRSIVLITGGLPQRLRIICYVRIFKLCFPSVNLPFLRLGHHLMI